MKRNSHLYEIGQKSKQYYTAYKEAYARKSQATADVEELRWPAEPNLQKRTASKGLVKWLKGKKKEHQQYKSHTQALESKYEAQIEIISNVGESSLDLIRNFSDYYDAALLEATEQGKVIITQNDVALSEARWKSEHILAGETNFTPLERLTLDDITEEELDRNYLAYPELEWDLTESEINQARAHLLRLPLTHYTEQPDLTTTQLSHHAQPTATDLLISYRQLRRTKWTSEDTLEGNTFQADIAMGLDDFVFMCLGATYPALGSSSPGRIYLIDSSILFEKDCLVTPNDITNVCSISEQIGIRSDGDIKLATKYRGAVVRGKDWLDILSRRLAKHFKDNPGSPFPIIDCFTLGELKMRSAIPNRYIKGIIDTDEEMQAYSAFIEQDPSLSWPKEMFTNYPLNEPVNI